MSKARTIILIAALLLSCAISRAESLSPYHVKAAFLYNFLKFVEWPETPGQKSDPYVVAVLGNDPFGPILDSTMRGKTVNGRNVVVLRVTEENMHQAHLLYVSASESSRYRDILGKLNTAPVLTVGETGEFAEMGGTIEFFSEGNKIRFEVNTSSARRCRLQISSTLLSLAKIVEPR